MSKLHEIAEQAKEGAAKAEKPKREIMMMSGAAEKGYWTEVANAEIGAGEVSELKDHFSDEDRKNLARVRELFNKAKEELGDTAGETTREGSGVEKGLTQDTALKIEELLSSLETALQK
jgi:hypothetical protein